MSVWPHRRGSGPPPPTGDLKSLSKENYEKLRHEILELGFSFPVNVWLDSNDGLYYIIDGHQRTRVVKQMIEIEVLSVRTPYRDRPGERCLPSQIESPSRNLPVWKNESQGLYEFMQTSEISFERISEGFQFPEVDLIKFNEEYFSQQQTQPSDSRDDVERSAGESGQSQAQATIKKVAIYLDGRTV
jgi:hypothetical protein